MADWNRFSKKNFLENLDKGQNLKVRKFQIHRTLESKVIKRKPTGGAHCAPPPPSTNRVNPIPTGGGAQTMCPPVGFLLITFLFLIQLE